MKNKILLFSIIILALLGLGIVALVLSKSQNDNTRTVFSNYFKIPELGVELELEEGIKDLTYYYDQQTLVATFSTNTLTSSSNNSCAAGPGVGPLGSVSKTQDANAGPGGSQLTPNGESILKLGDNYFYRLLPQSTCSSEESVNSLAAQQREMFNESFKTIRLIQ